MDINFWFAVEVYPEGATSNTTLEWTVERIEWIVEGATIAPNIGDGVILTEALVVTNRDWSWDMTSLSIGVSLPGGPISYEQYLTFVAAAKPVLAVQTSLANAPLAARGIAIH